VLAFGFAFQTYRLSWQTTILSAEFFQRFVQVTGALPAALGFPVPDAQAVAQVGQAGAGFVPQAAGQREWAWWLMGCVAVYGLLPRALLALLSGWRWRAGVARLAGVDMADPEVQRIVRRLDALEPPPAVIDAEHPGAAAAAPAAGGRAARRARGGRSASSCRPELPWPAHRFRRRRCASAAARPSARRPAAAGRHAPAVAAAAGARAGQPRPRHGALRARGRRAGAAHGAVAGGRGRRLGRALARLVEIRRF
jgi:hypothetical protein